MFQRCAFLYLLVLVLLTPACGVKGVPVPPMPTDPKKTDDYPYTRPGSAPPMPADETDVQDYDEDSPPDSKVDDPNSEDSIDEDYKE